MSDSRKIPEGLEVTAWIVGGLLAYFAFRSLGDWLVFEAWREHETVVRCAAIALCVLAGAAMCLRLEPSLPAWLSKDRLAWIAAVCGFFGLLILFPIDSR